MLKSIFKKNRNSIYICSITENLIKVIKCISKGGQKNEISGLEIERIPPDSDDKKITEKLSQLLQGLGFSNNPIILSLPRSQITCRNLKIPSKSEQEIERIANLQASHYLPYSIDELISSYQLLNTDKEGYSNILLVIAHKDVIGRYTNILKPLLPERINIMPSSNGLANLYNFVESDKSATVMIVDIDSPLVELAIISSDKLLFSRSFRLTDNADWEVLFINEINKTREAYLKDVSKEAISKIVFIGPEKIALRCQEALNRQGSIRAEIFSYAAKVKCGKNVLEKIQNADTSFASLIGLGLRETPSTLNLLPKDIKEKENKGLRIKEYSRLTVLVAGIILVWIIAVAKNADNKEKDLGNLRAILAKVITEARPLEEMEKKLRIFENNNQKQSPALDLMHDLYQVMPDQVFLTNFSYEGQDKVTLRGQAPELNSVLSFVSLLEKSEAFKKYSIKMRYATQRKTQAGEALNFEITCTKK